MKAFPIFIHYKGGLYARVLDNVRAKDEFVAIYREMAPPNRWFYSPGRFTPTGKFWKVERIQWRGVVARHTEKEGVLVTLRDLL